jgi:glycine oxidase
VGLTGIAGTISNVVPVTSAPLGIRPRGMLESSPLFIDESYQRSSSMHDVAIIGGGVIGLSLAWELAGRGASVVVLDQSRPGTEASWAGAGMLPPGNLEAATTPEGRLRGLSHSLWPRWSAELLELTGIDNGFRREGGLELRLSEDDASDRLSPLDREFAHWRDQQIRVELLDRVEARRCEPRLSPRVAGAIRWPDMGQVRNPRHLKALLAGCLARGVEIRSGEPVRDIVVRDGRVDRLVLDSVDASAGQYIAAAGAWTSSLLRRANVSPEIQPLRGQIVLLERLPRPFQHVLNIGPRYLVPRGDGRVLCGSTEEVAGFDKRNTAEGVAGLLELARTLVPELAEATLERSWAGLRPRTPDGLPHLGPLPGVGNLWIAAGHFRAGLQLSPGTAAALAPLVLGQASPISLEGFEVDRTFGSTERVTPGGCE